MSKTNVETPEIEQLGEVAMSRTEKFFEENGKKVVITICSIVVVAAAIFGYNALIVEPMEQRASEAMYGVQTIFEGNAPDYQTALDGSGDMAGFLEIIENYGSTRSANLANHYAGICYLKLGDNAEATKYLKAYKPQKGIPAAIINAQNIGLQGDIAVDEGAYAAAAELFKKASKSSDNPLTAPLFLRKAAQAAQAAGNTAEAASLYQSIIELYPASMEARNATKFLGTIK